MVILTKKLRKKGKVSLIVIIPDRGHDLEDIVQEVTHPNRGKTKKGEAEETDPEAAVQSRFPKANPGQEGKEV